MGNTSSSGRGHYDETVDYGSLVPQGVYTGTRDWNQAVVSQAIVARRLAPFYRPLEDYEESWDDDQILAARKELPDPEAADTITRIEATATQNRSSKRPSSLKEIAKPEAQIYRGAVECPICFLYYPPNINHSRCCDQAICTECFVQIKRAEPTATHMVSEPAACPYCVQDNFGVVYTPPIWRAGLGSEGHNGLFSDTNRSVEPSPPPTHKRRQKSFGAESPEVVTTDQIRPDWEAKLDAVRATVARRANRRIIMRQVGDRLIPVGVTSGRIHALTPEEAAAAGAVEGGSRRSRRRQAAQAGPYEQFMGMAGQDLEELMLMEAMRLSLLDHEEQQRKEAEEKKKKNDTAAGITGETSESSPTSSTSVPPSSGVPSTFEAQSSLTGSSIPSFRGASVNRSGPSSQPTHAQVNSQDSLAPGRKSWSLSRSRTPPPPLVNPAANVPCSGENQAAWRSRISGPPAFSTLSAALTSTSTAAAFLGSAPSSQHPSRSVTPEPRIASSVPPVLLEADTGSQAGNANLTSQINSNTPIPTITVMNNELLHTTLSDAPYPTSSSTPSNFSASGDSHADSESNAIASTSSSTTLDSRESGAGFGIASYVDGAGPTQSNSLMTMTTASASTDIEEITPKVVNVPPPSTNKEEMSR